MCKSPIDQESCIYADNIRAIRQKEYDTKDLYSEIDEAIAEQKEKSQCDFLTFFRKEAQERHYNNDNMCNTWIRVSNLLLEFNNNEPLLFANINQNLMEKFKQFLLRAPQGGNKNGTISTNTACSYYSIFKAALKQAFVEGYLPIDIAAKSKNIQAEESRREHLTLDELNKLVETPCENPVIKRAALFSGLTGLRHSDIKKMTWKEIAKEGEHYRVNFTQKKTKGVEYTPISDQAYFFCGKPGHPDELVFGGLPAPSWISKPLSRWIAAAGITKHITFHCFRHTYACLQLSNGTDLYTVSKMLGHTNIRTTQIYSKVEDEKKEQAADAIKLNLNLAKTTEEA
jgi:integrase